MPKFPVIHVKLEKNLDKQDNSSHQIAQKPKPPKKWKRQTITKHQESTENVVMGGKRQNEEQEFWSTRNESLKKACIDGKEASKSTMEAAE